MTANPDFCELARRAHVDSSVGPLGAVAPFLVRGDAIDTIERDRAFGAAGSRQSLARRMLRATIHFLAYHFILKLDRTSVARAAGFRLTVLPTVFHPRYFITSEFFAASLARLDFAGQRVVDVGTGSGILALAAARAGAANVLAVDINPNAARTAAGNARANGLDDRVYAVCSNLLSALPPQPLFDVILSSLPSFPGEPRDLADRAWHAGSAYRDIAALFEQARERLTPGGRFYLLLSSDSDLELLGSLMEKARFCAQLIAQRSIFIEKLLLYELRADPALAQTKEK
jgi:release factor glutamine methyltransferase